MGPQFQVFFSKASVDLEYRLKDASLDVAVTEEDRTPLRLALERLTPLVIASSQGVAMECGAKIWRRVVAGEKN
jgi:hypothetical protein